MDDDKVYTFYFSPTKGLATLNNMLLADDYIKIVTKTPTGDIDLLASGNSLLYEDVEVSSETAEQVSGSTLSLKLTSVTSIAMNLNVAMTGASRLSAQYEGLCYNVTPSSDRTIRLDKQIFFYYYGLSTKVQDVNDYYLAVTNLDSWTGSGETFAPTSEGYILTLDFYGAAGDNWKDFPSGTFTESDSNDKQTYYSASTFSFVTYCAADGTSTELKLTGEPVVITNNLNGTYTVTANFIDLDDTDRTIEYTGELNVANGTVQTYLPQIGKDIQFDGVGTDDHPGGYADAIYYGDVYDSGTGLMSIYIYDNKGANNEPGGYGMSIMLMTRTFNEDPYIEAGRYEIASTFNRWTALPGVEGNLMGGIIPWGTYVATVDESENESGYYSYAESGTIVIDEVPGDRGYFHISFNLQSMDGFSIKGEFEGDIPVKDSSDDDDGNDGSTNLETNVEMDLSYIQKKPVDARLSPRSEIYAAGLGNIPVESISTGQLPGGGTYSPTGTACGYQVIDIGLSTGTYLPDPMYPTVGKLHPGDAIRLDLLVAPGTEDKITPGTYEVTADRYPVHMMPGVCVRGYTGVAGNDGTRYQEVTEAIGYGYPYGLDEQYHTDENLQRPGPINRATMGLYACVYGGSVTISLAEVKDGVQEYTFDFNFMDVLNHQITGTWTGPLYLNGNSGSPVQPNADGTATAAAPTAAAAGARIALEKDKVKATKDFSCQAKRFSY